jgi:hypothetical protein
MLNLGLVIIALSGFTLLDDLVQGLGLNYCSGPMKL